MKTVVSLVSGILQLCIISQALAQNRLDVLEVDEANSQLLLRGNFEEVKSVSVDDFPMTIVSLSDTLVLADIPRTGQGSAGLVRVITSKGELTRTLTLYEATLGAELMYWSGGQFNPPSSGGGPSLAARWRFDIDVPTSKTPTISTQYVMQSSVMTINDYSNSSLPTAILPWAKKEDLTDSCYSLTITIDRAEHKFHFSKIDVRRTHPESRFRVFEYGIRPLAYDSLGYLERYSEEGKKLGEYVLTHVTRTKVTFPPSWQSAARAKIDYKPDFHLVGRTLFVQRQISDASLQVYDLLGRLIFQRSLHRNEGEMGVTLEVPFGAYLVSLKDVGQRSMARIFVQD